MPCRVGAEVGAKVSKKNVNREDRLGLICRVLSVSRIRPTRLCGGGQSFATG